MRSISHSVARVGAGLAAAAVVAGLAGACSASPWAATVDGVTIPQAALDQELAYTADSPAYVRLEQDITLQSTSDTVSFSGAGPGTHSAAWTALALTNLVQAQVVHHALAGAGGGRAGPGPGRLAAARGVLEALMGQAGFSGLPPAFGDRIVTRLADHASLEPADQVAPQLQQVYEQRLADFYRQVCVRQVSVAVEARGGSVDFGASRAAALRQSQAQLSGGTVTCYTQAEMESLGSRLRTTVMALAPGQVSVPVRTSQGYYVVAVVSRDTEPYAGPVAQALETVLLQLEPTLDTPLLGLEARARVRVDPTYGTWDRGQRNGGVPGVGPPATATRVPGAPATTVPSYDPFGAA
ncbi:MAG: hypothetical protein ACRDY0_02040 [Acidimicrobiales bacterium]